MVMMKFPNRQRYLPEKALLEKQTVIGFPIVAESFTIQLNTVMGWAEQHLSKVVCVANVHMLVEAKTHPSFAKVLRHADMLTPDGMPLAWVISWLKLRYQDRVAGMDILLNVCRQAPNSGVSLFFLGSTPEILRGMRERLESEFPEVKIAGMEALPFRPLTSCEDEELTERLNNSGANIIFVSLGCPKQEWWMHHHYGKVDAVMIGLGGVFPIFSGIQKWAPEWVRRHGLEWAYRLMQEPKRLWSRYAKTIPPFVWLVCVQLVKVKLGLNPDKAVRETIFRFYSQG